MEDLWVALAGPLAHVPMAAAWFGIYLIFERYEDYQFDADASWDIDALDGYDGFVSTLAEQAMFLNAGLFAFNVFVPAYPLDGGRILAAILVLCRCSVQCAAYLTSTVALLLAACMVAYGVYDLFIDGNGNDGNGNDGADGGAPIVLILIGVWIALNSFALLRCAVMGKATDHALFAKECYRRRAGVGESATDIDNNNDGSTMEVSPSKRELRQQRKEEKKRAREEKKRTKQPIIPNDNHNADDMGESSFGFGQDRPPPPPSSTIQDLEPLPPPSDPVLSPAGGGTSWTTFHTVSDPDPSPTLGESSDTDNKQRQRDGGGGGGGRSFTKLFGKRNRPSQSNLADDFVV